MDDFTWGATRKVDGEEKETGVSQKQGEFDGSDINLFTYSAWMKIRNGHAPSSNLSRARYQRDVMDRSHSVMRVRMESESSWGSKSSTLSNSSLDESRNSIISNILDGRHSPERSDSRRVVTGLSSLSGALEPQEP